MKAPQLDIYLNHLEHNPREGNQKHLKNLRLIYAQMQGLKEQGEDGLRSIWMEASRGTPDDFGSYKDYKREGEVKNKKEFHALWLEYYPDPVKWYQFSVSVYNKELFFYFNSSLFCSITPDEKLKTWMDIETEFINWLKVTVHAVIQKIKSGPEEYNEYIAKNLPYSKRTGRILRSDYWTIFSEEKKVFKKNITLEHIKTLEKVKKFSGLENLPSGMKKMTAGIFYRCCEMGYDTNGYFNKFKKKLSPKEKYLAMADGRDCGLKDIDENSEEAFIKWMKADRFGGHPWEVCRGGNSTHISLHVHKAPKGWVLILDGSSSVRVIETVKFALVLYKKRIPFVLREAEEILRMVTGTDFIGIVPENVTPRYCHSFFPKADRIHDFMNLGYEKTEGIIKKAHWYQEGVVEIY